MAEMENIDLSINDLAVTTTGETSTAIVLQSIGGGGGQGGSVMAKATNSDMDAKLGGLAATDAGSGGGGGNGLVSLDAAVLNLQTTGTMQQVSSRKVSVEEGSAGSAVNDVQGGDIGLNFAIGGSGGAGGDGEKSHSQ